MNSTSISLGLYEIKWPITAHCEGHVGLGLIVECKLLNWVGSKWSRPNIEIKIILSIHSHFSVN